MNKQETFSEDDFYDYITNLMKKHGQVLKDVPEYQFDISKKTVGYTKHFIKLADGKQIEVMEKHKIKRIFDDGGEKITPGQTIYFTIFK